MQHVISSYNNGYRDTEHFCLNCGKEGFELIGSQCLGGNPVKMICGMCGQANYPFELPCSNCKSIRQKFLFAVDKQNNRN